MATTATPQEKYTIDDGGAFVADMMQVATKHAQKVPAKGAEFASYLREFMASTESFEDKTGRMFDPVEQGAAISRYSQLLNTLYTPPANSSGGTQATAQQRLEAFFDGVSSLALDVVGKLDKEATTNGTSSTGGSATRTSTPTALGFDDSSLGGDFVGTGVVQIPENSSLGRPVASTPSTRTGGTTTTPTRATTNKVTGSGTSTTTTPDGTGRSTITNTVTPGTGRVNATSTNTMQADETPFETSITRMSTMTKPKSTSKSAVAKNKDAVTSNLGFDDAGNLFAQVGGIGKKFADEYRGATERSVPENAKIVEYARGLYDTVVGFMEDAGAEINLDAAEIGEFMKKTTLAMNEFGTLDTDGDGGNGERKLTDRVKALNNGLFDAAIQLVTDAGDEDKAATTAKTNNLVSAMNTPAVSAGTPTTFNTSGSGLNGAMDTIANMIAAPV